MPHQQDPTAHLHEAPQPQTDNHRSGWWSMPTPMDFDAMVSQRFNGDVTHAAREYMQLYNDHPPLEASGRLASTLHSYQEEQQKKSVAS